MSRSKVRRTSLNSLWIFALRLKRSTRPQALKLDDGADDDAADDDDDDGNATVTAVDDNDNSDVELIFKTISL